MNTKPRREIQSKTRKQMKTSTSPIREISKSVVNKERLFDHYVTMETMETQ